MKIVENKVNKQGKRIVRGDATKLEKRTSLGDFASKRVVNLFLCMHIGQSFLTSLLSVMEGQ